MTAQQNYNQFTRVMTQLDLADEAVAFLKAKDLVREKYEVYRACRDQYIKANSLNGFKWGDLLDDRAFQLATGKPYREYRKARQQQYNAERRMDRRFRKLIQQGAVL